MFIILASEKEAEEKQFEDTKEIKNDDEHLKKRRTNKKDLEKNKDDDENLRKNGKNEALKEIGAVCD